MKNQIVIGGASGFWGDAARATPQLLATEQLDYIVYDYLAEITMSIMARARAKDPNKGYALDFVSAAMGPNLQEIAKQGVKVISNAGGVNPLACTQALRSLIQEQGLELKVACIMGDDLINDRAQIATSNTTEMFTGADFPAIDTLQSINAYLGAFPIAQALDMGADIVITGRCVDSAVTLGACIHEYGWQCHEFDKLAQGSLAGHILECGPQATGGNFTDWHLVAERIHEIGYPITEIQPHGDFICTKPEGTGGVVSIGTVAEQMLYEIGDPQAYLLPDVSCDFSQVTMKEVGTNRVRVEGATGTPPPSTYKVCATYTDEFRGGTFLNFYGIDAEQKARALAKAIFAASRRAFTAASMPDFTATSVEVIGAESQYGDFSEQPSSREVAMKIAAKHPLAAGIGIMLREAVGVGLATPPGLCGFQGARPKPSPVVRLFSFELDKEKLEVMVEFEGVTSLAERSDSDAAPHGAEHHADKPVFNPKKASFDSPTTQVKLYKLAWARSGDKGDKANIGVIARRPEFYPYILQAVTAGAVHARLQHFLAEPEDVNSVDCFYLPGTSAVNFLIHNVLGGGGMASLRNDAQGKGFSQLLLEMPVELPLALIA